MPAHLERAGPFNPNGNNGFNIEHLRNFNNAAPRVAFGMETQPGHGASDNRGEYAIRRNNFGTGIGLVDTRRRHDLGRHRRLRRADRRRLGRAARRRPQLVVLRELRLAQPRLVRSRRPPHDAGLLPRRVPARLRDGAPESAQQRPQLPLNPQEIVDGLRSGNSWTDSGQLVDRLAFVACADTRIPDRVGNAIMEAATLVAAVLNTDVDLGRCATMGEKLVVKPGEEVVVAVVARDPSGTSYSPYTFANPSLVQIGAQQPLNKPVLDHIDVIRGLVTGYRDPREPGRVRRRVAARLDQQPRSWRTCPPAAKNTSAAVLKTFSAQHVERAARCGRRVQARRVPDSERPAVAVLAVARHEPAGERAVRDRRERQSAGRPSGRTRPAISGTGPSGTHARRRRTATCAFRARPSARRTSTAAPRTWARATASSTRATTSQHGPTCGSTAIRSTSKFKAEAKSPAFNKVTRSHRLGAAFTRGARSFLQRLQVKDVYAIWNRSECRRDAPRVRLPNWLREPLLHFAVLGAVLFAADYALVGRAEDPHSIVIDAAVDAESQRVFAEARGRQPNDEELYALRRVWLDNEVLYREGLALRLDDGDPAIRARVIFKALSVIDAGLTRPPIDDEHAAHLVRGAPCSLRRTGALRLRGGRVERRRRRKPTCSRSSRT